MGKKILCTLPNASELISGIAFAALADNSGVLSVEEVDDEIAAGFEGIPGYKVLDPTDPVVVGKPAKRAKADGGDPPPAA